MLNMATPQNSTNSTSALTPQQVQCIHALITGVSITEATKLVNIDRTTYYNWLKNPTFEAELSRQKEAQTQACFRQLQGLAEAAGEALRETLNNADTPPLVRIKAAIVILQCLGLPTITQV